MGTCEADAPNAENVTDASRMVVAGSGVWGRPSWAGGLRHLDPGGRGGRGASRRRHHELSALQSTPRPNRCDQHEFRELVCFPVDGVVARCGRIRLVGAENPDTSCGLHVFVYETAESISPHRSECSTGRWSSGACGRLLMERAVRAMSVVVLGVLLKDQRQVAWSGDQQVVEAFAAQGADEAFGDRVSRAVPGPGCGGWRCRRRRTRRRRRR
jgi:hypothetical protein